LEKAKAAFDRPLRHLSASEVRRLQVTSQLAGPPVSEADEYRVLRLEILGVERMAGRRVAAATLH
jgi:hypothetical protein